MSRPRQKITYNDLTFIIGTAKGNYVQNTLPMKVSKRQLDVTEPAHVAMIEAVVMFLDSKGLLNCSVKMDYDESTDF